MTVKKFKSVMSKRMLQKSCVEKYDVREVRESENEVEKVSETVLWKWQRYRRRWKAS